MKNASTAISATRATDLPRLYTTLTKARLSLLVVVTTFVGFLMASDTRIDWWTLLYTVAGTMACSLSANALNQVFETRRDGLMDRTRNRPTPSGALSTRHAFVVAVILGYGGLVILGLLVNLYAAGLAILTMLLYLLAYTPLKPVSTLNTIVGAIVGGIPPMIGWVAVRDTLDLQAWILGGILFVWQLPHFLALAWIYREQYAGAGFRMLPGTPGGGTITGETVLLTTILLVPLGLAVTLSGMAGTIYAAVSLVAGLGFIWKSFQFFRNQNRETARGTFLYSLLYLPVILAAMALDRQLITENDVINVDMNPKAVQTTTPS